ncbi:hypothetical protein ACJJTC_012627 [Scirpophaga incertulas]
MILRHARSSKALDGNSQEEKKKNEVVQERTMQTQTSQMSPIYEDNEVEFEPFKEVEDKRKTQNEENFEEEVIRAVSTASGQESTTNPVEVTESGQKASNRTRQIVMPKRFEDYYTGFMRRFISFISPFAIHYRKNSDVAGIDNKNEITL